MAYLQTGNWLDDARRFAGNLQGALQQVQTTAQTTAQAAQNLTKTGQIKMVQEVKFPSYLKYSLFAGLGLAAYYVFFRRK